MHSSTIRDAVLPEIGLSAGEIREAIAAMKNDDVPVFDAKKGSPVYFASEEQIAVVRDAYMGTFAENPLYTKYFPSLKRMEGEVMGMIVNMLNAPDGAGSLTSGGTESIFMGVKAARDRARLEHPEITEPEIVAPFTAHPAFSKAAHYLGLRITRTALLPDHSAPDLDAYRAAIGPNTVLLVGSAPEYPFGTIDPIPEMAALALERNINFHTDGCLGGFLLPFAEQAGFDIPPWDFRVPGVSSISLDVHKFGYAARGTSAIAWRNEDLYQYQPYEFNEWPSGGYATPSITGTKPPGAVAAAWAVMHFLGAKGYRDTVDRSIRYTRKLIEGIRAIPELQVIGDPRAAIFSYMSDSLDIFAVATAMERRGWGMARGATPPAIHVMQFNNQEGASPEPYLVDLRAAVDDVKAGRITRESAAAGYNT